MSGFERVLIFTAHADDCEFFAGGFVAKLAGAGARITEIIATDNARGSFEMDGASLVAESRDREAKEAARILGKEDVVFLGHPDGFLDEVPKNELRRVFILWIRRIRPDLVLTFDAFAPFETHPDHIHVARAAIEALSFSHMPLYHPEQLEDGLAPHLVKSRYYFAKDDRLSKHVEDISETCGKKIDALAAHESQMRAMITEFRAIIELTGKYTELLPMLDADRYRPAIEFLVESWASKIGGRAGLEKGEAFRVEEVGDIFKQAVDS